MTPLELPIYFGSDDDPQLEELGLPGTPLESCPIKKCVFLRIDSINPYTSDVGSEFSKLWIGSNSFITPIPYPSMVKLIEQATGIDVWTCDYEQ